MLWVRWMELVRVGLHMGEGGFSKKCVRTHVSETL